MTENMRLYWSMLLCTFIFIFWYTIFPPTSLSLPSPKPSSSPVVMQQPPAARQADDPAKYTVQAALPPTEILPFATHLLAGTVTNAQARLDSVHLRQFHEREGQKHPWVSLAVSANERPRADFANTGQAILSLDWDQQPQLGQPLALTAQGENFVLNGTIGDQATVKIDINPIKDRYFLNYRVKLSNTSDNQHVAQLAVKLRLATEDAPKSFFSSSPTPLPLKGFCSDGQKTWDFRDAKALRQPYLSKYAAQIVGIDKQYFVVALNGFDGENDHCTMLSQANDLQVTKYFTKVTLLAKTSKEWRFQLYLGPKRYDDLNAVSPQFTQMIQYTFLTIPLGWLARWMSQLLKIFYTWTNSWGLAIIFLTFTIKSLVFPIYAMSVRSARRMQALKPELDRIKETFKDDPERAQMEQLRLYRDKKVNPLGGCLPNLLQIPLWYVLYQLLQNAVDLYQQSFLWLPDLTAREPLPFLAFTAGGLTLLQQRMMPMPGIEPAQAKMMMTIIPAMMCALMLSLPSGLVLYFLVNTILTIFQQLVINRYPT